MPVSKRLRYEVLRRDNHACRYCGRTAPEVKLTIDHVVPVALGGSDEPSNLVTACQECNSGKSSATPDQPLVEDVSQDALRWSSAISDAANALLAARERTAATRQPFVDAWNDWTYQGWTTGAGGKRTYGPVTEPLPVAWEQKVDSILASGLPMELLIECVDITMSRKGVKDRFSYMCGVAWNKVATLREIAASIAVATKDDG